MARPVVLERMPQQSGLLGAEDDWTGVTNAAARRRVQNRINQRAYSESSAIQLSWTTAGFDSWHRRETKADGGKTTLLR